MKQMSRGIVLAIAVVLGLLTSAMVYFYLAKQRVKTNPVIAVVVASQSIHTGNTITPEMLKLRERSRSSVPSGTIIDPTAAVGQVAKTEIQSGEPITLDNVTPKNRLAYVIPPFMRAVTVAVDPVVGVGGFLKVGDHVDVIATFSQNDASVAKTVLQDVVLLATGSDLTGSDGKDQKDQRPQSHATLAVMPADAERLILADTRGKLRLTLRRPDDSSFVSAKGVTGREVIGILATDKTAKPASLSVAKAEKPTPPVSPQVTKSMPLYPEMQFPPAKVQPVAATTSLLPVVNAKTIQVVRGAKIEQVEVSR